MGHNSPPYHQSTGIDTVNTINSPDRIVLRSLDDGMVAIKVNASSPDGAIAVLSRAYWGLKDAGYRVATLVSHAEQGD